MRWITFSVLLGCWALPVSAQSKSQPKPGDAMIERYLAAECDRLSQKFLDGAKTIDEWKAKRPRLIREYYDMLGLWPIPEKTPLKATVTRTFENQGAVIENLHYQSKPGLYVTANFYRPRNPPSAKLPTILYVCGHSGRGRDGNKSAFQDHGLWFANNGYNCLILDTLQLGEIPGIHHGTYGLRGTKSAEAPTRMWWHSAGYTPAGVECWNGVRGIDYLLTRPDGDADKIGVTGISGGGAATIWIAAADERVKVAVPVSGMSDLESYIKNKIINGHCDCMFLYNTHQWDWTTIAALIAPRPMLFANSDNDPIFPMDANRRIIEKLRKAYTMYGKPDLVDEYVSVGGHDYRPDLRVAIFKFINKHLKGDTTSRVMDAKFDKIEGKELRAFPTDDDLPADRINGKVDEVFVPRGKVELPQANAFGDWRKQTIAAIREASFRGVPDTIPPGKGYLAMDSLFVQTGRHAIVIPSSKVKDSSPLLVLVDRPDAPEKRIEVLTKANDGHDLVLVGPVGATALAWTKKSPPNYIERSHMLLGPTVDRGKIEDYLAAVGYLHESWKLKDLRVAGYGRDGILAAYAALLAPIVSEVILVDPPMSHADGPHLPNILRVLDIPDALGLLAPRPLTIIGDDPAFDRTAEIYRLAGAADKLKRIKK